MTSGATDLPKVGHVLRYVYLFAAEAAKGREEGIKERFVVVVGVRDRRYLVAAITTKGEGRPNAVALPPPVARAGGVSPDSSVVVDEYNVFTWPGFDIRPLMSGQGFIAGRLTPSFTDKIITELVSRKAKPIERD